MNELKRLEAWLIKRAAIHEANSDVYRGDDLKHMLLVSNAKRNECLTMLEYVRLMIEEGKQ